MTNIWIMRKSETGISRVLLRADAINYLDADDRQVRASLSGSNEISVLVDAKDGGLDGPLLPDDFSLTLLFAISQAKQDALLATDDPDEEDRVLVAQLEGGEWVWKTFRPSAPEPKAS
ncbi:hypothetical protein [Streptomyces sp. NPDC005533]|uniref:hypothetical protein n=1 Tax=Streptomyces sp. NPDC005533 TaxID=3364723 RepID=UPI0036B0EAB8